jgi:hypothetical protein
MNLFILSLDPAKIAEYMMDKHIAKIILEAAQMLCSTKRILDADEPERVKSDNLIGGVYKIAHKNHPVTIWCRASQANFIWTLDLIDAMNAEWKYRYGHPESKQHKSFIVAQYLRQNVPAAHKFEKVKISGIMTPFALAMPDEYKVRAKPGIAGNGVSHGDETFDAVASYRRYYLSEAKRRIATWKKKRGMPAWYASSIAKMMNTVPKKLKFVIIRRSTS